MVSKPMRRIIVSTSIVCSLAVFVSVRIANSAPPSKPGSTPSKPGSAKDKTSAPAGYGNSDSMTEEEMKVYDYFLASDQLEGRNLPSRGFDTAALYVASHLAEWGIKPGGSATNTNGPLQPYLMPIELVSKQVVPDESKSSIVAPAAGGRGGRGGANASSQPRATDFEYTKDWTANSGGRGAPPLVPVDVTGNLVFAGNGYVINKTNINPYEGLDVRGKIIVVAGLPPELAAQQAATAAGRGGRGGGGGGGRGAATNPLGQNCT